MATKKVEPQTASNANPATPNPLMGDNPNFHGDKNIHKASTIEVDSTPIPSPQPETVRVITGRDVGPLLVGEDSDLTGPPWNVPVGTIQGRTTNPPLPPEYEEVVEGDSRLEDVFNTDTEK